MDLARRATYDKEHAKLDALPVMKARLLRSCWSGWRSRSCAVKASTRRIQSSRPSSHSRSSRPSRLRKSVTVTEIFAERQRKPPERRNGELRQQSLRPSPCAKLQTQSERRPSALNRRETSVFQFRRTAPVDRYTRCGWRRKAKGGGEWPLMRYTLTPKVLFRSDKAASAGWNTDWPNLC